MKGSAALVIQSQHGRPENTAEAPYTLICMLSTKPTFIF